MQAIDTLIRPVVTEKATGQSAKLTYTFWVNRKATKIDIKLAMKEIYGVDVASVRVAISPSKKKAIRKSVIDKRSAMKKAFITLKGGKKLDVHKITKGDKK